MFDFWPLYSGKRFRASWPSCLCVVIGWVPSNQKYLNNLGLLLDHPFLFIWPHFHYIDQSMYRLLFSESVVIFLRLSSTEHGRVNDEVLMAEPWCRPKYLLSKLFYALNKDFKILIRLCCSMCFAVWRSLPVSIKYTSSIKQIIFSFGGGRVVRWCWVIFQCRAS